MQKSTRNGSLVKMMDQRPFVDKKSAYLYEIYESNLTHVEPDSVLPVKINVERTFLEFEARDAILLSSLEFEKCVQLQRDLETTKLELWKKIEINNEVLERVKNSRGDPTKSYETLNLLTVQLMKIDTDLTLVENKLKSHNAKVAMLSSVQELVTNVKFPGYKLANHDDQTSLDFVDSSYIDELISHIASVLVQRDISLPNPATGNGSSELKLAWIKSCIDSLLLLPQAGISTPITRSRQMIGDLVTDSPNLEDSKETISLKTALKDLQFAHQYLTRQYEEERSVNNQAMNVLRTKLQKNQESLLKTNKELSKQALNVINLETQLNNKNIELLDQTQEITELNKKLNLLQIDHLGENQLTPPTSSSNTFIDDRNALSPVTGYGFSGTDSKHSSSEIPVLLQSSISNNVLRVEFKKLLNDVTTKHEQELQKEKQERLKLENLIKMMNKDTN